MPLFEKPQNKKLVCIKSAKRPRFLAKQIFFEVFLFSRLLKSFKNITEKPIY